MLSKLKFRGALYVTALGCFSLTSNSWATPFGIAYGVSSLVEEMDICPFSLSFLLLLGFRCKALALTASVAGE
ncbi:hypothetical protein F5Y17DRAFT_436718 [Xylariaceae sp. FL0594]|nr:hypothetical protein F5Y17DRAFT_436718 [Xylariaceae sp. FL0594]